MASKYNSENIKNLYGYPKQSVLVLSNSTLTCFLRIQGRLDPDQKGWATYSHLQGLKSPNPALTLQNLYFLLTGQLSRLNYSSCVVYAGGKCSTMYRHKALGCQQL
ncbi:hypothetical protein XELAEV_18021201mg [Xenopus laevis]|uniref:Uncharacterized protein n=1 Tax=Xenopus laevis TaxID=8355 RepID=A0A974DBA8_XENLA|nr:hypothetical protein XELAEV_18021201mg [Xenopus laevis]